MVCVDCAHIKKVHCKLSQNNILPFKNFNVFFSIFSILAKHSTANKHFLPCS